MRLAAQTPSSPLGAQPTGNQVGGGPFGSVLGSGQSTPGNQRSNVIRDEAATIKCVHVYPISAQTDGLISEMFVDEGVTVKKGDHLLTIDDRIAQVEVSVAKKEWEAAESQAKETANVEFAVKTSELADAEFKAESEMFLKGAAGESQLKRKKLEAEKARFGIRVSEVEHKKEGFAAESAREKYNAAQVRLQLHRVMASHDGIIVRRDRDQGEWTRAGEPVLQFMGMQEMKVQAFVPVRGISITSLEGAPMRIEVPINNTEVITMDAKVDYVSPEIENGKVRVSARVQNQAQVESGSCVKAWSQLLKSRLSSRTRCDVVHGYHARRTGTSLQTH